MKTIIFFVIALAAISCLKQGENKYYIKTTGRAEITQVDIPETASNNQPTPIMVRAEGSNGCWRDLNFKLTKNSDFDYLLEAFGTYESTGTCPDVKVYGDTTISFKPTKAGLYIFHVLKSQDETEVDSMIVADI